MIDNIYYHLQVLLLPGDLRHVSQFGTDGEDGLPRALKAIFVDVDLENDLLKMKPQLRHSNLILREFLTSKQNDIFNQAKLARKNHLLQSTYT